MFVFNENDDAWSPRGARALLDEWRECRNDARHVPVVNAIVNFSYHAGLLTSQQRELWQRRIVTCPGHDDEGGRAWCAYCGTLANG